MHPSKRDVEFNFTFIVRKASKTFLSWTFLGELSLRRIIHTVSSWLCAPFIHLQWAFLSLIEGCMKVTKLAQVWTQWNRILSLFPFLSLDFSLYATKECNMSGISVLEFIGVFMSNMNASLYQGAGVCCSWIRRTLWGICRHCSQSHPTWHAGVLPRPRWVTSRDGLPTGPMASALGPLITMSRGGIENPINENECLFMFDIWVL